MTISRLRTPILLVGAFVLAFGAALWALAAAGGTDSVRAATDDAEVSAGDKEACSERKERMLDSLVEKEIITEEQKTTVEDLTEQLKNGDLTKEEFKAAIEDAEIDLPHPGKGSHRGHRGFGGADKGEPSADETVATIAL